MADNSKILLTKNDASEQISVDPHVLEVILGIAAGKTEGVAGMRGNLKSGLKRVLGQEDRGKGVVVHMDEDGILTGDVYVYLNSGVNVPEVATKLQKRLKDQMAQMTDLDMGRINIHVVGLIFPDELPIEEADDKLFPEDQQD
ncbi:MAG: Asp23/Gls24 family envelope stress response protein [Lactobacillus sp.]|nr:Asp23/Gls24 family envelope stress response protein [Lactobacillus sp.]